MNSEEALAQGVRQLGLDIPPERQQKLLELLRLMAQWNRIYNLSAVRSELLAVSVHLLDSLAILSSLPEVPVLDVGSGAGFPGVPLAVARPQVEVTMIEANGKKTAFVRHAIARLGLPNAKVVQERVERWNTQQRFPAIVSRAFAELRTFVELAGHLLAPGGRMYAMKGRFDREEAASLPVAWTVREVARLDVPGLNAERHLVVIAPERT